MRCPVGARTVVSVPVVFLMVIAALALRPVIAGADGGDPIGAFDWMSRIGPSQFSDCSTDVCGPVHSVWTLAGWAADPDAPGQSIDVHLYLDGVQIIDTQTRAPRPDVAAVYPWAGDRTGWGNVVVYIHDDEPHTLCAYAI